MTDPHTSRG